MAYIGILNNAKDENLPFQDLKKKSQGTVNYLSRKIAAIEKNKNIHACFVSMIEDLQSTPFCEDPGKNHRAVFLLDQNRNWAIYECVEDVDMGSYVSKVKQNLPRIKLEDTLQQECPVCKTSSFVLQIYYQTEDSPEGDEWMKNHALLCPHCRRVFQIGSPQYSPHRF